MSEAVPQGWDLHHSSHHSAAVEAGRLGCLENAELLLDVDSNVKHFGGGCTYSSSELKNVSTPPPQKTTIFSSAKSVLFMSKKQLKRFAELCCQLSRVLNHNVCYPI